VSVVDRGFDLTVGWVVAYWSARSATVRCPIRNGSNVQSCSNKKQMAELKYSCIFLVHKNRVV